MKKNNTVRNIIKQGVRTVLNEQIIMPLPSDRLEKTSTKKSIPIWKNADALHSNINRDLEKAKKYWRTRLKHPVTAVRWQKAHKKSAADWKRVLKGYLNVINLAHINPMSSYVVGDKHKKAAGVKAAIGGPIKYKIDHDAGATYSAMVKGRGGKPLSPVTKKQMKIYVRVYPDISADELDVFDFTNSEVEFNTKYPDMTAILVHEIQHLLYYWWPLSPSDLLQKSFPGGDRMRTGRSGIRVGGPGYTGKLTNQFLDKEIIRLAMLTLKLFDQKTLKVKSKYVKSIKQYIAKRDEFKLQNSPITKSGPEEKPNIPQVYTEYQEWRVLFSAHKNKFLPVEKQMKQFYKLADYNPERVKGYYFRKLCVWIIKIEATGGCDYACDQNEKLSDIEAARYQKYLSSGGDVMDNFIKPKEFARAFHKVGGKGLYQEVKCFACNGFQPDPWDIMTNLNQLVKSKATGDELGDKTQTMA